MLRILDKFTGRTKPVRISGDPDNQSPDKWSSTVYTFEYVVFKSVQTDFLMTMYTNLVYKCFLRDDGPERGETNRTL